MAIGESFVKGTELKELKFVNAQDWWVKWNDPSVLWNQQPTYLVSQGLYLLGALLTLTHALCGRGRLPFLWLAIAGHGLVVEAISYVVPDVDNFWHAQAPLMFLGRRLPLHIIVLYPCFLYQAVAGVSKLRLPRWAEPFAVGLTVVLIDLPYDIVSVKFAHWSWHDTDPNIFDRHYWVPWNSYYFHATFAAGFIFWFHALHTWMGGRYEDRWTRNSIGKEFLTMVGAMLLGAPTGVLMFVPLYHPLHDIFKIHSEVTFFILFAIFLSLAWAGDHAVKEAARPAKGETERERERIVTPRTVLLLLHLVVHYAVWIALAAFGNPENEVSTGLHEPVGPCNQKVPVQTVTGLVLEKRKYLCVKDYDEKYFDFHCLPKNKVPADGAHWYTICGTPFENRLEYLVIVGAITFVALVVFYTMHLKSASERILAPRSAPAPAAAKKVKTK